MTAAPRFATYADIAALPDNPVGKFLGGWRRGRQPAFDATELPLSRPGVD